MVAGGDEMTVDFSEPEQDRLSEGATGIGLPAVSTTEKRVALVIGTGSGRARAPALPNPTVTHEGDGQDAEAVGGLRCG